MRLTSVLLYAASIALLYAPAWAEDHGKRLFDGVSLNGWKAFDMSYWTIKTYSDKDRNTCEIKAGGDRIEVSLNGHVTAVIEDLQEEERELSGVLALQLHSGPPMKIQFKDIFLKTL